MTCDHYGDCGGGGGVCGVSPMVHAMCCKGLSLPCKSKTLKRYHHMGGIAGKPADLKLNEVPAILMGSPVGTCEEDLLVSDPRHRDKLGGGVMDIIRAMDGRSKNEVRDIIARAATKPEMNAVAELVGIHARGKREIGGRVSAGSMYQVNERGPELLQIAGKQYLMMGN